MEVPKVLCSKSNTQSYSSIGNQMSSKINRPGRPIRAEADVVQYWRVVECTHNRQSESLGTHSGQRQCRL